MSGEAIVMMIVAMVVIWGGLALAMIRLNRADRRRDAGPKGSHLS